MLSKLPGAALTFSADSLLAITLVNFRSMMLLMLCDRGNNNSFGMHFVSDQVLESNEVRQK